MTKPRIIPCVVAIGLVLGLSACTNPYDPVQRTIGRHRCVPQDQRGDDHRERPGTPGGVAEHRLAAVQRQVVAVPAEDRAQPVAGRYALANAYAFGGNNVSVLLETVAS